MPSGKEKEHIMTRKIHAVVPAFRDEFLQPFDTVFDQLLGQSFPDMAKEFGPDFFSKGSYPKVDVIDKDAEVYICAEVPGLTKECVDIDVVQDKENPNRNILTVSGSARTYVNDDRSDEHESEPRYIRRELKRSAFKRSFVLGENLNADKVSAKFENGLLEIDIPKIKPIETTPRKVDIK